MNITVCIKQVPGSTNVKVDPVTGVLIRDGIESKMNPYDLYALEAALVLREQVGGTVTAVTMGPNAAKAVLSEAIYMGADKAVLISDRKFAGADVLATSYTLSSAIGSMAEKSDIIICGKQTTDGDTAQVGAEMAEFLGIPHYSNVSSMTKTENGIGFVCTLGNMILEAEMQTPCLISVDGDINTPRLPSYKRKRALETEEQLITVLSLQDFEDKNPQNYGLSGSPTQVEKIFPPEKKSEHTVLTGDSKTVAQGIMNVLTGKKFI